MWVGAGHDPPLREHPGPVRGQNAMQRAAALPGVPAPAAPIAAPRRTSPAPEDSDALPAEETPATGEPAA
jgi:hypothetical protein